MPRQLRIEYEGAIYHIMSRGNRGDIIFKDDIDREKFLTTLGEACSKSGWQVHAYCLMNNHFHLVIETPRPTLVTGMKWLLGTYSQRFNIRHQQKGHLFAGRYKSLLVDESDNCYLRTVCDYVHLNPVRAHLLKEGESLQNYQWSSFGIYLMSPQKRPPWVRIDRLFGEHGITEDNALGRQIFAALMNQRISEQDGDEALYKIIKHGWKIGAMNFIERLHEKIHRQAKKENHFSSVINESEEVRGRKLIEEQLDKLQITLQDLKKLPCTNPKKITIAQYLRLNTTLSLTWIAHELKAGTPGTLANSLNNKKCNI